MNNFKQFWSKYKEEVVYENRPEESLPKERGPINDILDKPELRDLPKEKVYRDLKEIDLKKIATHPDVVEAIKTVYSIPGRDDRHGGYSDDRAVGMLKRAAEIVHKEQGYVDEPSYINKIVEFLKKSAERGKGYPVSGLDDLPSEVLSTMPSDEPSKPEDVEPEPEDQPEMEPEPQVEPEQPPVEEPQGDEDMEDIINPEDQELQESPQHTDHEDLYHKLKETGYRFLKDANMQYFWESSGEDPVKQGPFTNPNEAVMNAWDHMQSKNPEMEGSLEECGTTAAAGAGVMDGTVNQAVSGVQGVAIKPSKLGQGLQKRLKEELDHQVDYSGLYGHDQTEEETEDRRSENESRRKHMIDMMRKNLKEVLTNMPAESDDEVMMEVEEEIEPTEELSEEEIQNTIEELDDGNGF